MQGKGVEEIRSLPQLVSGTSDSAVKKATEIFEKNQGIIMRKTSFAAAERLKSTIQK